MGCSVHSVFEPFRIQPLFLIHQSFQVNVTKTLLDQFKSSEIVKTQARALLYTYDLTTDVIESKSTHR